jgi:uncharacterized protein YbaR (Trm112 family)
MNLQLTDHLTCPRCTEGGGLILLADRVEGRRLLDGQLGCPNCRARYPVVNGVAEFEEASDPSPGMSPGEALRVAALLGVTEGPASVVVVGPYVALAGELAALLSDVEIVVASRGAFVPEGEMERVSRLRIAARIPLHDRSMRGALITGSDALLIAEAVRVVGLAARVVLTRATPEARAVLLQQGVHVIAEQDDTLVVVRHS